MKAKIVKADSCGEVGSEEHCFISELWNSCTEEGLSIARARVEPGITTVRHCLDGIVERYLITQGNGCVEAGELPPTDVGVGDLVIIPAGVSQRISNRGKTDLIFYCICTPRFDNSCYHTVSK